jgi:hypothetical protein
MKDCFALCGVQSGKGLSAFDGGNTFGLGHLLKIVG